MNAKRKADVMARELRGHVDLLLVTKTIAMMQREKCDAIQRRLLGTGSYGGDGNPRTTYLLTEAASRRYFTDLDAAYLEAGYKVEPGHCPALIAEYEQTRAEWALIAAAEAYFPGVTNDRLLCGTSSLGGLEARQKYLDLLTGLVVSHPEYVPPTARKAQ